MSGHCGGKRDTPAIRERFDIMCSTPTLPPRTLSCYNPFSLLPSTIKSEPSHLVHVNSHHIGNALFNMVITLSLPTTAIYSLPTFKHGIKSKLFSCRLIFPFLSSTEILSTANGVPFSVQQRNPLQVKSVQNCVIFSCQEIKNLCKIFVFYVLLMVAHIRTAILSLCLRRKYANPSYLYKNYCTLK